MVENKNHSQLDCTKFIMYVLFYTVEDNDFVEVEYIPFWDAIYTPRCQVDFEQIPDIVKNITDKVGNELAFYSNGVGGEFYSRFAFLVTGLDPASSEYLIRTFPNDAQVSELGLTKITEQS